MTKVSDVQREDVQVEHVDHDCATPGILPLPEGARFVIARWKCPVCGRKWRIKSWASSSVAESYGWRRPEWTRPKWLRAGEHPGRQLHPNEGD